jgi:hypothetical protein
VGILVLGIVAFALFQMMDRTSLRALAQNDRAAHSIFTALTKMGRHSLAWRLAREESDMRLALRYPLLGSGQWNWWQSGEFRPWSLWLLALGMYGLVGLLALGAILFLPVVSAAWSSSDGNHGESDIRQALAAVILMLAFDNLLNGAMILPYLLLMGGLTTRSNSQPRKTPSPGLRFPVPPRLNGQLSTGFRRFKKIGLRSAAACATFNP